MNIIKITDGNETLILDGDAIPSIDDMNSIIRSVANNDAEFERICELSTSFADDMTCEQFEAACRAA
jgi:hypothetical protein